MKPELVVLEGEFVRLEPMLIEHVEELYEAGGDESLWRYSQSNITSLEGMRHYVETALEDEKRGVCLPFVTIVKSSNKIVGSTRFGSIDPQNLRTEIGWTWINPKWQRTFVNTEAKLLMLSHAFEEWGCIRVELRTDVLNEKSRQAILRLGATEEGIFRQQMITETGRVRDSVYFSILDKEWQTVKKNLLAKLSHR
jgi:N-acetyltransferase